MSTNINNNNNNKNKVIPINTTSSKKKEKIKQLRKDQYDKMALLTEASNNNLTNNNSNLTTKSNDNYINNNINRNLNIKLNVSEIKIDDFLEARKTELSSFVNILNNKLSTKSGHQLLPKHMRRRAMSHNPFRVTIKFRNPNFNSESTSKCGKHKRKRKQFLKILNKRRINSGWLETHIWHAKRFTMKYLFGRKIAYKRTDKSVRCVMKYVSDILKRIKNPDFFEEKQPIEYSLLYDNSYYKNLFINFEDAGEETRKDFLNSLFFVNKSENKSFISDISKLTVFDCLLYSNTDYSLIGPVEILNFGIYNVIINFHPFFPLL